MKLYQSIYGNDPVSIVDVTTYQDLTTTRKAYVLSSGVTIDAGIFLTKYKLIN